MTETAAENRRIVLARRPDASLQHGDLRMERVPLPTIDDGELLLRTLWLSLDPYMRSRMNDAPSYAEPVAIDAVMVGATVSRVIASKHAAHAVGDLVLAASGWQDYAVSDGTGLTRLDTDMPRPSLALGAMGMPGFTAFVGMLDIGQPKVGETVLVSAATGAVGSIAGQIAKLRGARVVGIAGGDEKCRYAVEQLHFDACVDHQQHDFAERLAAACPSGVDVFFENVGGAVWEAALPLLNDHARIALSGLIANYNRAAPSDGPDQTAQWLRILLTRRVSLRGFIIFEHYKTRHEAFVEQMSGWLREQRIVVVEDVIEGLEHAPAGLMGLLRGDNLGKLVVRVAD
ncbi:NADP-dependent oxidoreductase [Solimonas terrae]|uniref:NADP-dependent oxidoreductase n=1 Tax=Solimonas terrae TaxID=1396819 RepID=A0A6M2BR56_9GAMM|nr:NADP-dependent oxidoreductase [Solimonas terrae]NGY04507.1 NADP-dependent oxidoreductase [Solimonas terrae]